MLFSKSKSNGGFTLIELVIIIIVLGILAAVAVPKLFNVTKEAETAAVANMVSSLESALSIYVAKQYLDGLSIVEHSPFDDLSNVPSNFNGTNDPVTAANTSNGTWSWVPTGNWIIYNPTSPITGGQTIGGESFISYQVQVVLSGTDTVGLRLNTTAAYIYSW